MTVQFGDLLLASWREFETLRGADAIAQFVAAELGISVDEAEERVRDLDGEVVVVRLRPRYRLDAPRPIDGPSLRTVRSDPAPRGAAPGRDPAPVRETQGMLALRLVTDDGIAIAGCALEVRDGVTTHALTTDANGLVTLTLQEGPYEVRLADTPVALPIAPSPRSEVRRDILIERDRSDAFVVTAGPVGAEPRTVAVRRPLCTEVLVDGYAEGASVMRWGGMRPRSDGSVATTRAALRQALSLARGQTIAVAGHADPLGQDSDNETLSAARATSLQLFLCGDLEGWAAHADANASELDFACALVACHRILGLGATTLDDEQGLDAAQRAIREAAGIANDAQRTAADWQAIAELYEEDLAALLFTDRAGLADLRRTIRWSDPTMFALGERHPRPDVELEDCDGEVALAHRRASIVIFADRDVLPADAQDDEIFDGTYVRTTVRTPGEVLVDIAVDTPTRDPIARGRAWIGVGGLGVHERIAGADGHIRFMTLRGDDIEVVAAFDANGRGTMVAAGTEG